ncbi:MAG: hypothetical protein HY059_09915 [Proteobacteria bacterium]|nr:hypothetical protein [Pseudomonadota bacterium]
MTKTPDVTPRREERKAGALAAFLSKLGLGGGSSASGAAAWGRVGHGALFGGLLATKTGLIALVLASTTVAAGVGIVGNQIGVFGVADEARDGMPSLFESFGRRRTAQAPPSATKAAAASSLGYVANANKGQLSPGEEAAQTQTAAADAAAIGVPDNNNAPANVSAHAKIGSMKGFANSDVAGGSTQAAAARAASAAGGESDTHGTGPGKLSSYRAVTKATAVPVHTALAGKKSALSQAQGVRNDNMSVLRSHTPSTQAAGATYDGAGRAQSIGSASSITGGGVGAGGNGIDPGVRPNGDVSTRNLPPPPQPGPAKELTPWKWAVNVAMGALAVAVLALFAAMFLKKQGNLMMAKIAAGVATAAAGVATAMGVMIMTTYKQMSQGMIWTLAGGALAAFAAYQLFTMDDKDPNTVARQAAAPPSNEATSEVTRNNVTPPVIQPPTTTASSEDTFTI